MSKNNREHREIELRAIENENNEMILEGYAVVYEQETLIGNEQWGWYETIARGALDNADIKDVPLKYNHGDSVPILARTRNHSLELSIDEQGLKIRAKLLDTQDSKDIYERVKAGLLDKMSFAFTIKSQEWTEDTIPKRRITQIEKLYDVSIVDTPAYEGTSIGARSREQAGYEKPIIDNVSRETKVLIARWS